MLGMIFGGPFWGMIADKWHCHRTVVIIMCLASFLTISTQPFVSVYYGNSDVNKCPYTAEVNTPSNLNTSLHGISYNNNASFGDDSSNKTFPSNRKTEKDPEEFTTLYFLMILINVAVCFAEGSAVGFVDTGTLRRSQLNTERPMRYGRQRMFAAFGAAVGKK